MALVSESVELRTLGQRNGSQNKGRCSPSLEAQQDDLEAKSGLRHWIHTLLAAHQIQEDVVEEQLKSAIEERDLREPSLVPFRTDEGFCLEYLLQEYGTFKHRRDATICRDMFRCYTFTDEDSQVEKSLPTTQNEIIAFLFARYLGIPRPCLGPLSDPHVFDLKRRLLEPPGDTPQGNLDPTQFKQNHIVLTWQGKAPVYKRDLDVFLHEQYKTLPEPRCAAVTLLPGTDEIETTVLILFQHLDSLEFFSKLTERRLESNFISDSPRVMSRAWRISRASKAIGAFRASRASVDTSTSEGSSTASKPSPSDELNAISTSGLRAESIAGNQVIKWLETSTSISAVFHVMLCDTAMFLKRSSVELEKLVSACLSTICSKNYAEGPHANRLKNLKARQSPSAGKLRYLVHLEDCRTSAYEGVVHGLEVLEYIQSWTKNQDSPPFWVGSEPCVDPFAGIRRELEWYREQLFIIGEKIEKLQGTLHDHLELTNTRRNYILSMVAAVYVTLSFTTSFFGMNMNTSTSVGPQGFTDWAITWINNSPAESQNSTRALVSTINSAGIQSYPWATFGITAGSLLATIPLSLGAGRAVRVTWQFIRIASLFWRILSGIPLLTFFVFSLIGNSLPSHIARLVWLISNICVALFLCSKAVGAFVYKKPRLAHWAAGSVITIAALVGTCFLPTSMLMLLPWLYFLQDCVRPAVRRWWREGGELEI